MNAFSNKFALTLIACAIHVVLWSEASAQHSVNGIALGERVPPNLTSQSYGCVPSDDFPGLTRCQRSRQVRATAGTQTESGTIMHAADGTALYLMSYSSPFAATKAAVEREIAQISNKLNSRPTEIRWSQSTPTAVIVRWGGLRFDELGLEGTDDISNGKSAKQGVLVDFLGDLTRSAKEGSTIFRVIGASGFVYTANYAQGHRRLVSIDASKVMAGKYEGEMLAILQRDRTLAASDFSLWTEVAEKTRRLRLDTTLALTEQAHDRVFGQHPSKLRSHLWARLPGSVIQGLGAHQYRPGIDYYGPKTLYPEIMQEIQSYIKSNPEDPFIEFAYFMSGELDKGLRVRPQSVVKDVLHYGIGHRSIRMLAREIIAVARSRDANVPKSFRDSSDRLSYINNNTKIFNNRPISELVDSFSARARAAEPHLLAVLNTPTSAVADDAAYMLGFLAYHGGDKSTALAHLEKALSVGNGDYKDAAIKQIGRVLMNFPPTEQVRLLETRPLLAAQSELIYVATRSAYRAHEFGLAVEFGERALGRLNIPPGRLPATTDPDRIASALKDVAPGLDNTYYVTDIGYLIEAARELGDYVTYAKSISSERPDVAKRKARDIIIKYSMITEGDVQAANGQTQRELQHRDLRQALHLINATLAGTPMTAPFADFRAWLYYRKTRIQTIWEPELVSGTVASLLQEAPTSKFANNAITEQIFAEGIMLHEIEAAQRTFQALLLAYPTGNAVDNAHSWMSLALYCAGRATDAKKIDREIINRFPLTRHALYAARRLAADADALPDRTSAVCRTRSESDAPDTDDIENVAPTRN